MAACMYRYSKVLNYAGSGINLTADATACRERSEIARKTFDKEKAPARTSRESVVDLARVALSACKDSIAKLIFSGKNGKQYYRSCFSMPEGATGGTSTIEMTGTGGLFCEAEVLFPT